MSAFIGIDPGVSGVSGGIAVYTLSDPLSPEIIRYVGWATNTRARLLKHLNEARSSNAKTHKLNWLRSLGDRVPILRVVALVETRAEAAAVEIKQIELYRSKGFDLTNSTKGGDGVVGWTPELRAKMSAIKTGKKLGPHSEEAKRRISQSQKGKSKPFTPAQVAAAAARRGRPIDRDVVERVTAKLRGRKRPPEETRRYIETLRTPELRARLSEAAKRQWQAGRGWARSEEARAKASAVKKAHWADGVYDQRLQNRNEDGTWARMPQLDL